MCLQLKISRLLKIGLGTICQAILAALISKRMLYHRETLTVTGMGISQVKIERLVHQIKFSKLKIL